MAEGMSGAGAPPAGSLRTAATVAQAIATASAAAAVATEALRQPNRFYVAAIASFDLMAVAAVAAVVAVALAGTRGPLRSTGAGLVGALLAVAAVVARLPGGQVTPTVRAILAVELVATVLLGAAAWPGLRDGWPGIGPVVLRAIGVAAAALAAVLAVADLASGELVRDGRAREQVGLLIAAGIGLVAGSLGRRAVVAVATVGALVVRLAVGGGAPDVLWLVPLGLGVVVAAVPPARIRAAGRALRSSGRWIGRMSAGSARSSGARLRATGRSAGPVRTRTAAAPPRQHLRDLERRERVLAAVLGVATVGVVIGTVLRARHVGWYPVGDDAIIATRAADVGTGRTPLLGLPTTLGPLGTEGLELHHPGPLLLWISSPFVRLLGPALGVMAAAAAVWSTAVVVAAWAALRARGATAALLTYGVLLVIALTAGSGVPFEPLNAYVPILPLAAVLVLAWSASCGVRGALPWTVGFASLCAQAYLPLAPTAFAATAFAGLAVAVPRWRAAGSHPPRRALVASAAVGVLAWSGPILDAVAHRGGNLVGLLDLEQASGPTIGPSGAGRTLLWLVSIPPGWVRPAPFRAEDAAVYLAGGGVLGALVLLAAVGVSVARWRVWDEGLRRVVAMAALALVVGSATLARLPTAFVFVYQVGWIGAVGGFALLAGSLVVVDEAARVPALAGVRAPARSVLLLGVVALLATLGWPRGLGHYASVAAPSQEAARRLAQEIGVGPGGDQPIAVLADGRSWEQVIANGIAMSLADHGRSIRVTPLLGAHWGTFRLAEQAPDDPVLIVSDGYSPLGPSTGRRIARYEPSSWSQPAADATAARVAAWAREHGPIVARPGLDGLLRSVVEGWVPDLDCGRLADLQAGRLPLDALPDGAIAQLYLEGVVESPALPDRLFRSLERNLVATPTEVWLADAAEAKASLDGPVAGTCA